MLRRGHEDGDGDFGNPDGVEATLDNVDGVGHSRLWLLAVLGGDLCTLGSSTGCTRAADIWFQQRESRLHFEQQQRLSALNHVWSLTFHFYQRLFLVKLFVQLFCWEVLNLFSSSLSLTKQP